MFVVDCLLDLERHRKRKRGLLTSSTLSRYRQTPHTLIRVKAHASGVSILSFTLVCYLYLPNLDNKIQADASIPMYV